MQRIGGLRTSCRATVLLCAGVAAPGHAQLLHDPLTVVVPPPPATTTQRSIFSRDGEVAVADRMLPEFSATGIRIGNFDLYPGVSIGGFYDSNVYADNDRKRDDAALVVRPEVTARTSAGPYAFTAYARGDVRRYATRISENTEEVLGGIQGSVATGAFSNVSAGVSYGSLIVPRFAAETPINAGKPLEYRALNGFAGATIEGASTRVILRADVDHYRYVDTPALDGGDLLTRDRDRTRYAGTVRVERALSPRVSVYGAASGNRIDYRLPLRGIGDRDSAGYGLYLGSNFELSRLARGDIRLGYVKQNFDLAGVRPIKGFGALGSLLIFPNRLWTFTLRGEASVQDSGVPGTLGIYHRGVSLRADHELRRYLIFSLYGEYYNDTYRGLPRRDRLPGAEAALTYLSKRHWNARLGYRYRARDCGCTGLATDFDDHRLAATLTLQY